MADAQENIEIRLTATDDASATIASVGAALERLGTGLNLGGIQSQLTGLGNALSGIGNTGLGALPDQMRALGTSLQEATAPAQALSSSLQDVARGADAVGTRMAAATDQVRTALAGQTDAVRQALALQTQLVQQAAAAQAQAARSTTTNIGVLGLGAAALGGLAGAASVSARDAEQMTALPEATRSFIPAEGTPSTTTAPALDPAIRAQVMGSATHLAENVRAMLEDANRVIAEARIIIAGMRAGAAGAVPPGFNAPNKAAGVAGEQQGFAGRTFDVDEDPVVHGATGPAQEKYIRVLGEVTEALVVWSPHLLASERLQKEYNEALAEARVRLGHVGRGGPTGGGTAGTFEESQSLLNPFSGLFSWWQGRAAQGPAPPTSTFRLQAPEAEPGAGGFFDLAARREGSEGFGSGFLRETAQIGSSFLIWGTLFGLFYQGQQALMGLASGLVTTNVEYQHLSATLSALYGSDGAGQRALDWADQLAEKLPQTREQVRQATLTLASAGVDIGPGLPAIAELTSAVHPVGGIQATAQAVVDAMAGRTEMLRVSLRTQIEPLRQFGLEVEKSGHIVQSSFIPAIERYIQMRFGEHVDVDAKALAGLNQQQLEVAHATMVAAGGRVAAGTLSESDARTQAVPDVLAAFADPRTSAHMALLHAYFGVTSADLRQINSDWDASTSSAQAAFQKWLEASYGGSTALAGVHAQLSATQKDFLTLGGAASNILDVFENLQRRAGLGISGALQGALSGYDPTKMAQPPKTLGGIVGAIGDTHGIGGALEGVANELGSAMGSAMDHLLGQLGDWYKQMGGFPGLLLAVTNGWRAFTSALGTVGNIAGGVAGGLKTLWDALSALWSVFGPIVNIIGSFVGGNQVLVGGLTTVVLGIKLVDGVLGMLGATVGQVTGMWTTFSTTLGLNTAALEANAAAARTAMVGLAAGTAVAGTGGPLTRLAGGLMIPAVPGGVGPPLPANLVSNVTVQGEGFLSTVGRIGGAMYAAVGPMLAFTAALVTLPAAFEAGLKAIQTGLFHHDVDAQNDALTRALTLSAQSPGLRMVPATPSLTPSATPTPTTTPGPTGTPVPTTLGPTPVTPQPQFVALPSPQEQFAQFLSTQKGAYQPFTGAGWSYERMQQTGDPYFFAQYLAQNPNSAITKQYLSMFPATAPAGQTSQQTIHQIMAADFPGMTATAFTQYNAAIAQVQRDAQSKLLHGNLPGDIALAAQAQGLISAGQHQTAAQQAAAIDATYNRLARQYGIPTLATTPPESQKPPSYGPDTYAQNLQRVQSHLQADILRGASPAALQADYGHIRDVAQRGERMGYADADAVFLALHQAQDAIAQHIKQQGQKAAAAAGETLSWQELVHAPLAAVTDTIAKVAAGLKQENESATQIALQKVQMIEAAGQAQLQYDSQTKASRAQVAADTAWIANNLHAAGLSMAEATRVANKMRDDLVRQSQGEEAKAAYTLALGQGHITSLSQVPGFVSAIMATEPSTAGPNQRALDQFQLMRQGQDAVLQNARDHLTFDIGAHASMKQLRADERDYLKILAVELGGTGSWAYKVAKQQVDAQIAGNNAAIAAIGAPPPHYARFGGLATAYGSATVSFGGLRDPESATVRELRQTNEHLRAALARDQSLINLLESELVVDKAQLGALQSINGHVAPPPPRPAQDVHAHIKSRGGFAPVGR